MSKEKQIEIKVVTYKEERLNYFTALYEKAKNKFNRLFKKHKDAPYLSDEFQKLSDAGHEAEFLGDVVMMLKQSEGEWIKHPVSYECTACKEKFFVEGYAEDYDPITDWDLYFCPNCGAKMKGGERHDH